MRWDLDASVTAFGPVSYFIEFLKVNGLWQGWVRDCPLAYTSPNAPPKQDFLGTILLSVLAGHKRYAHVTPIRSDSVTPELLGMQRVRSEDAVRRPFHNGDADEYARWLQTHLEASYEELLSEPWIILKTAVHPRQPRPASMFTPPRAVLRNHLLGGARSSRAAQ